MQQSRAKKAGAGHQGRIQGAQYHFAGKPVSRHPAPVHFPPLTQEGLQCACRTDSGLGRGRRHAATGGRGRVKKGVGERLRHEPLLLGARFLLNPVIHVVTMRLTRSSTSISHRPLHGSRILQQVEVVLSANHRGPLMEEHIHLRRVEAVLGRLKLGSVENSIGGLLQPLLA